MQPSRLPRAFFLPFLGLALAVSAGLSACGPKNDGVPVAYTIVFSLADSPEDLALLSFQVAYSDGNFDGSGAGVDCDLVADEDDESAEFDDDDDGLLKVEIDATENPLSPAIEIVTCQFTWGTQPTAGDFTVTVLSAEDDAGDPVDADDVDVVVTGTDLTDTAAEGLGEIAGEGRP